MSIMLVAGLFLPALLMGALGVAWAQSNLPQRRLEIAGLDVSQFPMVGVNLIVTDRQSQPVRDLSRVRLRESGAPVPEFDVALETVGTDVIFVVDANSRIQEDDVAGGMTRLQGVKDSILGYAGRFMDLAGRDRVTVIVPDGAEGRLLAQDVTLPAELIEAVQPYDAGRLPQSSVVDLLEAALAHAAAYRDDGRFQAIVLYSDGAGVNEALFEPLVAEARALDVPIFVLLLGAATPSEGATEVASALTTPTRGRFAALARTADSSEIFQVIVDNGVQSQLRYRSNVRRSGAYSVTATLESLRAETTLSIELRAPEVRLDAPETIQRVGATADAPLDALQPAVQPLAVEVTWPDGLPRALAQATLLANDEVQDAPFFGAPPLLTFDWNIAGLNEGRYELSVVMTDTLGFTASSDEQLVNVALSRPQAQPTLAPTATPEPLQALRELLPPLPAQEAVAPYVAPVAGVLGVLLMILVGARWMQARRQEDEDELLPPDDESDGVAADTSTSALTGRAYLERIQGSSEPSHSQGVGSEAGSGRLWLPGMNVTIGSEEGAVQVVLHEKSVSPLHARIRRRGDVYWLYDEGSEEGTQLNFERLGLAPQPLREGDIVQLGRTRWRFGVQVGEVSDDRAEPPSELTAEEAVDPPLPETGDGENVNDDLGDRLED